MRALVIAACAWAFWPIVAVLVVLAVQTTRDLFTDDGDPALEEDREVELLEQWWDLPTRDGRVA